MKAIEEVIKEARKHNPCEAQFNKLLYFYEKKDLDNAWATVWGSIDWCKKHNILTQEDFNKHCTVAKGWYSNGQLSYECNYVNGVLHGLLKRWDYNGKPSYEYNYVNGIR